MGGKGQEYNHSARYTPEDVPMRPIIWHSEYKLKKTVVVGFSFCSLYYNHSGSYVLFRCSCSHGSCVCCERLTAASMSSDGDFEVLTHHSPEAPQDANWLRLGVKNIYKGRVLLPSSFSKNSFNTGQMPGFSPEPYPHPRTP